MYVLKETPHSDVAADITRQSGAGDKTGEFRKSFFSKIRGGKEESANIVVLFSPPMKNILKKTENYINSAKPDLLVLEEEKNPKFDEMLKGKTEIREYLPYSLHLPKEYGLKFYGFLKQNKKKFRIEQLSPPGGLISAEVYKKFDKPYQTVFSKVERGDFEGAVELVINIRKEEAKIAKEHGEKRAAEVVEKIRSGEWRGNIVIQSFNPSFRNSLLEKTRGMKNVKVESLYKGEDELNEFFGNRIVEVFDPSVELLRLYQHGKQPTPEKEKLLAARSALALMINELPTEIDDEFKRSYKQLKLVNQLDYRECESLFRKIGKLSRRKGVQLIEDYLETKRNGGDLSPFLNEEKEPVKHAEAGKKTKVTLFYEFHSSSCLNKLIEYVEKVKPAVIIIEDIDNTKFKGMLEGRMSVDEYMWETGYHFFPARSKKLFQFLKEQSKSAEVRPIAPGWEYHGGSSFTEIERNFASNTSKGDFEGMVATGISSAKSIAEWTSECERMRVEDVVQKIQTGELGGEILIMSGAAHRLTRHLLVEELKGTDVEVNTIYAFKGVGEKVFDRVVSDASSPLDELAKLYQHARQITPEKEKLLAARGVLANMLQKSSDDTEFKAETRTFEVTKMVNQLSYEECKRLFKEIKNMWHVASFEFLDVYLRKRNGIPLARVPAEEESSLGGQPLTDFSKSKKDGSAIVKWHADEYKVKVNDEKEVSVELSRRKRVFWRDGREARYKNGDIFLTLLGSNQTIHIPRVEDNTPYFSVRREIIRAFVHAGLTPENQKIFDDWLISLNDMKQMLESAKKGKLKLEEKHLRNFEDIVKYENEIKQVAALAEDAKKLRRHPKVEEIFEEKVDRFIESMKKKEA